MQQSVLLPVLIAVAIGLFIGLLILSSIALLRGRTRINSLIQLPELVGRLAIVEVPFEPYQVGKIRVAYHGKTLQVNASTDDANSLQPGDVVLIVEMRQAIAWVVPETSLYA